jgi:hypothetical protein
MLELLMTIEDMSPEHEGQPTSIPQESKDQNTFDPYWFMPLPAPKDGPDLDQARREALRSLREAQDNLEIQGGDSLVLDRLLQQMSDEKYANDPVQLERMIAKLDERAEHLPDAALDFYKPQLENRLRSLQPESESVQNSEPTKVPNDLDDDLDKMLDKAIDTASEKSAFDELIESTKDLQPDTHAAYPPVSEDHKARCFGRDKTQHIKPRVG